jgi:hypothetical protein
VEGWRKKDGKDEAREGLGNLGLGLGERASGWDEDGDGRLFRGQGLAAAMSDENSGRETRACQHDRADKAIPRCFHSFMGS